MRQPEQQRKELYRRLAEINRAITTSLNFDEVLRLIVENAAQLVRTRICLILLLDKDGSLLIRASQGVDPELTASFSGTMEEDVIKKLHNSLGVASNESLASVPVIAKHSHSGLLVTIRDLPLNEEEECQLSDLA